MSRFTNYSIVELHLKRLEKYLSLFFHFIQLLLQVERIIERSAKQKVGTGDFISFSSLVRQTEQKNHFSNKRNEKKRTKCNEPEMIE